MCDRGIALTYSGEVYNCGELRRELAGSGWHSATRSDTEVVLGAYQQGGTDCVRRFNGMFAFAVWDGERRRPFLARDRLGVKPLYYHAYDGGLLFGSEPKALLANPRFEAVLDEEGLAELFAMFGSHTPGPRVLRGLPAGRPGWTVVADEAGVRDPPGL